LRVPDLFSNGRWSFLSWNINTCFKILFSRKNKFDLIFTVSTPVADHVSGLILKKVLNLPWVVFFSDAWVDNSSACQNLNGALKAHKFFQRKVIEKADALLFITEELRNTFLARYSVDYRYKCFVVPHSFYPDFDSIIPHRNAEDGNKLLFRYVGSSTVSRSPEILLSAIALSKKLSSGIEKSFKFEFIGRAYPGLKGLIKKYALEKEVFEIPPVSYLESLRYMRGADVLININSDAKTDIFLPSKLIEYLGARKPIFGIVPKEGSCADLIREANGFLAQPDNPEEIADKIIEIVKKKEKKELRRHLPDNSAIDKYRIENVAKEYAKVFNGVILRRYNKKIVFCNP
ncbi:MAG: glycosyltransferase, partial [Candidatus Omnitrophica bacterium]|nr:glycosyltransferase [Candidatus Omnitrophota bacterium]